MDALVYMKQLPSESVDMIHTDPPWGVSHKNNINFNDSFDYLNENIDKWMEENESNLKVYSETNKIIVDLTDLYEECKNKM